MILGDTALTILLLLIDDSKIPTRNPYFFTPWFFIAQDMHDCFESLRVILLLQIWTHFRLTQALCSWMPESCQVLATLSTVKKRPSGKPELEQVFQIPSCHTVMASVGKQRVLACVWDSPHGHKLKQKEDYFLIILIKKSKEERGIHCQFFTSSPNSSKTGFLSFCHHQKLQAENSQITVCKSLPNWWSVLRCLFLMSWNP